VQKAQKPDKAF